MVSAGRQMVNVWLQWHRYKAASTTAVCSEPHHSPTDNWETFTLLSPLSVDLCCQMRTEKLVFWSAGDLRQCVWTLKASVCSVCFKQSSYQIIEHHLRPTFWAAADRHSGFSLMLSFHILNMWTTRCNIMKTSNRVIHYHHLYEARCRDYKDREMESGGGCDSRLSFKTLVLLRGGQMHIIQTALLKHT